MARKIKEPAATLEPFDLVVITDALRIVLNEDGEDDYPTISAIPEDLMAPFRNVKERLVSNPILEVSKRNIEHTPINKREYQVLLFMLDKLINRDTENKLNDSRKSAAIKLFSALTNCM